MKNRKEKKRRFFPVLLCLFAMMAGGMTVSAAQKPVQAELPVGQEFQTEYAPEGLEDTFTYLLTAKDGAPLPEEAEDGVYRFEMKGTQERMLQVTYTTGGIYEYTLSQEIGDQQANYTYDRQTYQVYVYVKNEPDNSLSAQVVIDNGNGKKTQNALFCNSYKGTAPQQGTGTGAGGEDSRDKVQTGDDTVVSVWILTALFSAAVGFWLISKKAAEKAEGDMQGRC